MILISCIGFDHAKTYIREVKVKESTFLGFIQKSMLLVACTFLMMHAFVPHTHHLPSGHQVDFYDSESNSVFDFLSVAFHLDQGENHLEDFERSDITFDFGLIQLGLLSIYNANLRAVSVQNVSEFFSYNQDAHSLIFRSCSSPRGPPAG